MTGPDRLRRTRAALGGERGSLPLAMLAVMVVGAAVTAMLATTYTGQRAARFDRDYTTVIQGADAGVQEAANRIVRGQLDTDHAEPAKTLGDTTYEWSVRRLDELSWEVESTGTRNGVTRTVRAVVADEPRFFVAAFADKGLKFTGGNGADSYGSSAWDTGNGIVASNEDIKLSGSSTDVDGVHLYNWDNDPRLARCDANGGTGCDDVKTMPDATMPSARIGPRLEVGGDLETDFITEQLADCAAGGPITSWTASVDGTVLGTPGTHEVLCFENMTFDRNTTIAADGSVEIYLSGRLSVSNGSGPGTPRLVNCADCQTAAPAPRSTDLTVYSVGEQAALGNHVKIAVALYAPLATCAGNGNAQSEVYGSIICQEISNQGGWQFHYDDRLLDVGTGTHRVRSWQEG